MQIKGQVITQVNKFKYLDSTVTKKKQDAGLDTQILSASKAFGELTKQVWLNELFSKKTKCAVYLVTVLLSFLYAAETWAIYKADGQGLHVSRVKKLNSKWWQYIPRIPITEKSKLPGMYNIRTHFNFRRTGHLNRLGDNRQWKQILYYQLRKGSRKTNNWQYQSENRKNWRKKSAGRCHRIR